MFHGHPSYKRIPHTPPPHWALLRPCVWSAAVWEQQAQARLSRDSQPAGPESDSSPSAWLRGILELEVRSGLPEQAEVGGGVAVM